MPQCSSEVFSGNEIKGREKKKGRSGAARPQCGDEGGHPMKKKGKKKKGGKALRTRSSRRMPGRVSAQRLFRGGEKKKEGKWGRYRGPHVAIDYQYETKMTRLMERGKEGEEKKRRKEGMSSLATTTIKGLSIVCRRGKKEADQWQ